MFYFKIRSGVSSSDPHVPLSYSSVDQRKFFKRPEKETIKEILETLKSLEKEMNCPFYDDSEEEWIAADQPQTFVQVNSVITENNQKIYTIY